MGKGLEPENHETTGGRSLIRELEIPVSYDCYGRMNYHPEFHFNQKKAWTIKDQKFLVEMYEKLGPDEVSLSLGRTIHTVMTRAYKLRKKGLMPKRSTGKKFRRNGREA